MYGSTVKPVSPVMFVDPVDQVVPPVMLMVTVPTCSLKKIPSITLVFSCAAGSVLPAVNVYLPDIKGLS
jgi:hypothetical protein